MMRYGKEEYISCPYEKSHQILESRIQFHLVKCAAVHPNVPLQVCPFNVTHKVPEPEFNIHCTYVCPDRCRVENYVAKSEEEAKPLFEVKKVQIQSSEDWDNVNVETYNPETYCQNAPVLQYKAGAPPSERKNFRARERLRVQLLRSGQPLVKPEDQPSTSGSVRLPQTQSRTGQAEFYDKFVPPMPIALKSLSPVPSTSKVDMSYSYMNYDPLKKEVSPDNLFYEEYKKMNEKKTEDEFIVPRYNARGRGRGRYLKK